MNYFIYTSYHFTLHGRYELNKLTSVPMCGFIAQLEEHRTGIMEVTGSNPVEALIFFRLLLSNCLIGNLTAMIILHYHSQPQFKYELFHIYTSSQILLGMFLEIQRDIRLKCHVTVSFMPKCRNQFHAKSCCLWDREISMVLLTI